MAKKKNTGINLTGDEYYYNPVYGVDPNQPETKNTKPKKKKKKKRKGVARFLFTVAQFAFFAIFVGLIIMFLRSDYSKEVTGLKSEADSLVDASSLDDFMGQRMSTIFDMNGETIAVLKNEKNIQYLQSSEIPQKVKDAFVSVEDKRFYQHGGVDIIATMRAAFKLVKKGTVTQGGSTITQQLSRNIFLNNKVTWQRKIEEMFIAWDLEGIYSKDEILEFYINNVFFANGCYGIESASQKYFGKTISECSISETAFLCAIPNSPTKYDPIENSENTITRRDTILLAMLNNEKITQDEYNAAISEEITLNVTQEETYESNWATVYAIHCSIETLMRQGGFVFQYDFPDMDSKQAYDAAYTEAYAQYKQKLYTGGYKVYTSLDMEKQNQLQAAIDGRLEAFNTKNENGTYALQSAATCIDNDTDMVVAIVGGRSQDDEGFSYDYNRGFLSFRQPGSSIKPLIVYTPCLERDYTPDTVVSDSKQADGPSNSGNSYAGRITLRTAVEKSKNTVAWQLFGILTPQVGIPYLVNMDFSEIVPADYTMAACLGGLTNGVSTLEMASAYSALANEGVFRSPTCVSSIIDSRGDSVFASSDREDKQIYDKNAARNMTNILEGVLISGTAAGKGLRNMPSAGKTGTTNENKDGWFVGYSPYYTTSVWVGYDTPRVLQGLTGSSYPAQIWHNYMAKIHEGLEEKALKD